MFKSERPFHRNGRCLGHHLKFAEPSVLEPKHGTGECIEDTFRTTPTSAKRFLLPVTPCAAAFCLPAVVSVDLSRGLDTAFYDSLGRDCGVVRRRFAGKRRFIALVKALLIAADVAGGSSRNWTEP